MAEQAEKNNQMSLTEAGEYDKRTFQRDKLTAWGQLSKARREQGISRKERRATRKAESTE